MRVPETVAEDWTYIHRLKKSRGDAKILNKKVNSHQVMRHWIIGYCEYLRALLGSFDMQMLTAASEVCHSGWSMVIIGIPYLRRSIWRASPAIHHPIISQTELSHASFM